jgi:hypothetical protein
VEARTVKQLASAEMNILGKIENMMFLITIVGLIASALGVMTTMITSVIERQKEIGLMKSVGAENKKIVSLFLSEATIIGLIGGPRLYHWNNPRPIYWLQCLFHVDYPPVRSNSYLHWDIHWSSTPCKYTACSKSCQCRACNRPTR